MVMKKGNDQKQNAEKRKNRMTALLMALILCVGMVSGTNKEVRAQSASQNSETQTASESDVTTENTANIAENTTKSAATVTHHEYTTEEVKETIQGIFEWAKSLTNADELIDKTFLEGADTSLNDWFAFAAGDLHKQAALLSLFTMKYGSVIVAEHIGYAEALPLYGLRQNLFTDPQKPMKVEPGVYPLNGADENSVCLTTVDFALTYFLVSGELERSGVPVNLIINDAGGLSVLTSWAAGKFSSSSIAKFFQEQDIEGKIKSRKLIIPGKVAVLKGELEAKMPGWEIIIAPNEAVQLVKFMKDFA